MTESHATETRAKGATATGRFRRSALRACGALALGLTLLACSSLEVRSEFDPSRVPESATSFAWLPTASARVDKTPPEAGRQKNRPRPVQPPRIARTAPRH